MYESLGDGNQANTYLGTYKNKKAVIKAVPDRDIPFLSSLYRWMIQREARALKILSPLDGVPNLLGIPNSDSIAIEFREGILLRNAETSDVSSDYFDQLEELVHSIHELGVVHSDLKKKENLMVGENGNPIVIDFGTHFVEKKGFSPFNDFMYQQFFQMDLNAVSKLRKQFFPDKLTSKDRKRLNSPTILERADRFRRNYIYDW